MKAAELVRTLTEMQKETEEGKRHWRMEVQTTEGKEEKYTVKEQGKEWTVDECYVAYRCQYRGREFNLITYEMIKTSGQDMRTMNYVFLPPSGIGVFSLHALMDYSLEANAVLIAKIRSLWEFLMGLVKKESGQVDFRIREASVSVEDDR